MMQAGLTHTRPSYLDGQGGIEEERDCAEVAQALQTLEQTQREDHKHSQQQGDTQSELERINLHVQHLGNQYRCQISDNYEECSACAQHESDGAAQAHTSTNDHLQS